ncbi:MAG: CvpA family protein [Anaerolineae bacterium]|jgi:uncharacterized membrane protein required for colicin V production
MLPIHTVFLILTVLFGLIGGLRGWAKEIIVVCSVIVALFFQHVLLLPMLPFRDLFYNLAPATRFYTRTVVFIIITIFGYASPSVISRIGAKVARERLQDILLGFFIGLLNGFLIIGTILAFLDMSQFGVPEDQRGVQQKVDANGDPVYNDDGTPAMEIVYYPGAKGIGGIVPPEPKTTSANLLAILPPRIIEQSEVALYLAVALSFVFVLIVFI